MARELGELIQPWDRIFPIPGTAPIWLKRGMMSIPPGGTSFTIFAAPKFWRIIIDQMEIVPLDPITLAAGDFRVDVGGSPFRPEASIFNAPPVGLDQIEFPDGIVVPERSEARLVFHNPDPVLFHNWFFSCRIFMERKAN